MTDVFERARSVADAVLYEGYLLYPYRATAAKNRVRWQFGVLVPPAFASDESGEYDHSRTECLLDVSPPARLHVRLRFLHVRQRLVRERTEDGGFEPVDALSVDGGTVRAFDEARERERDVAVDLDELLESDVDVAVHEQASEETEDVRDGHGVLHGRVTHRYRELSGRIRLGAERLAGPYGGIRLRLVVENTSDRRELPDREEAVRHSFVSAHLLLGVDRGAFLSLTDPPEWASGAAADCENVRSWPVLLGPGDRSEAMLAAPIILYDNPEIAPESDRQLYDATEIDEILTLRTMVLTDEEKEEARGTDARARELIDGIDDMPAEMMERLHGTLRYLRSAVSEQQPSGEFAAAGAESGVAAPPDAPWWDPGMDASVSPDTDGVDIAGVTVAAGSKVRLHPGHRSTDAQDMFLKGRVATVRAVFLDVDDERYLAVTLDEDPGAEIQGAHGRFRYFFTDEVDPVTDSGSEHDSGSGVAR